MTVCTFVLYNCRDNYRNDRALSRVRDLAFLFPTIDASFAEHRDGARYRTPELNWSLKLNQLMACQLRTRARKCSPFIFNESSACVVGQLEMMEFKV